MGNSLGSEALEEYRRGCSRGIYSRGVEARSSVNLADEQQVQSAITTFIARVIPLDVWEMLGDENARAFYGGGLRGIEFESIPLLPKSN